MKLHPWTEIYAYSEDIINIPDMMSYSDSKHSEPIGNNSI